MRTSAAVSFALLGLAAATPVPQDIDFDAYNAIPYAEDVSAPIGAVVSSAVSYNPSLAASSAVAAATAAPGSSISKRGVCAPYTPGNYPTVEPDTDAAFLADTDFTTIANNAATPPGYFLVEGFQNLHASASDPSYLTYVSSKLTSYDPEACAVLCNGISGCNSFNIYFERDPSVNADDQSCIDPSSVTRIKCAFFGTSLTLADATNVGQYQGGFHVVQAGSNAYTTSPQPLPGFTGPVSLGGFAIQAPPNTDTYMGVQTFPTTQPYDPSVCAAACLQKTAYNLRHGVDRTCVFFDAYILYENGVNGVFTCTYYTAAYGPAQATNPGQFDGHGNHFTVSHSYAYTLDS